MGDTKKIVSKTKTGANAVGTSAAIVGALLCLNLIASRAVPPGDFNLTGRAKLINQQVITAFREPQLLVR